MDYLMWTEPPELTTGATNLLICCICIISAVLISRIRTGQALRRNLWLILFLIMIPTCVFGFFVHAIVLSPRTKVIAWIFLSVLLGLTTATLSVSVFYETFGRPHLRKIIIINLAALIVFAVIVCILSGIIENIHHVFLAYTGLVLAVLLVLLFVKQTVRPHFWWYIAAILAVVVGGLFELCGDFTVSLIWMFDEGSACHLGIAVAMCLFAAGCIRGEGEADDTLESSEMKK